MLVSEKKKLDIYGWFSISECISLSKIIAFYNTKRWNKKKSESKEF